MQAFFMTAAAHLSYLKPDNQVYKNAELRYLARATSGLRAALAEEVSHDSANALIAAAILLYNQAWSSLEHLNSTMLEDAYDPAIDVDSMLPLGAGLRGLIYAPSVWKSLWRSSIFIDVIMHSPRVIMNEYTQNTKFPGKITELLVQEYLRLWPLSSSNDEDDAVHSSGDSYSDFVAYVTESSRLVPILSMLNCAADVDLQPLESSIVRYICTWPIILGPRLLSMAREKKTSVLLLFYYFYAAVNAGIPEKFWWAQKRKAFMTKALENSLAKEGITPRQLLAGTALLST